MAKYNKDCNQAITAVFLHKRIGLYLQPIKFIQDFMDLSVIVPVYNEQENLPLLYDRLIGVVKTLGVCYEFVFVNDGSKDQSIFILHQLAEKDPNVKFIDFSRNFGHQIAVTAGIDKVDGDAVVIIDADLQDPPEAIIDLYKKMQEGYEVCLCPKSYKKGGKLVEKMDSKELLPHSCKDYYRRNSCRYRRF